AAVAGAHGDRAGDALVADAGWLRHSTELRGGHRAAVPDGPVQPGVQLEAPPDIRGRVVGLFNMAQQGLRVGSGFTVGIMGGMIGIHWSLGLSALIMLLLAWRILTYLGPRRRAPARVGA